MEATETHAALTHKRTREMSTDLTGHFRMLLFQFFEHQLTTNVRMSVCWCWCECLHARV